MDKNPGCNMLLGRPWIHRAKAVPSTLFIQVQIYNEESKKLWIVHADPNPYQLASQSNKAAAMRNLVPSINRHPKEQHFNHEEVTRRVK